MGSKDGSSDDEFGLPLRALTTLRGPRVANAVGFRGKMHAAKERTKQKARDTKEKLKTGSVTSVDKTDGKATRPLTAERKVGEPLQSAVWRGLGVTQSVSDAN